ncbi:putative membrane protein [Nitrospirillum amazonense]|uniref:Putative membrane protein n=1 Tax=Nitrospirillum amazonense TaxID=28077 RepID=A0A560ER64_9PROT|nr:DUF2231 domain-containing protein [Nitrospirillum amazonense]TWB11852.1 putative membrane protein [Nitrospirillum amazonense]
MPSDITRSTVQGTPVHLTTVESTTTEVVRHPLYPMLAPFPSVCFVGAFFTDLAYWGTAEMMWADFSAWLLFAGVVLGCLALVAGLVDLGQRRYVVTQAPIWPHVLGNLVALGLAILNCFVHSRDAWTSVVPQGLILSALVLIVVLTSNWIGWSVLVYRRRVVEVRP